MIPRTITRSAETDVEPDVILEVLTDATLLPQWAPAFADTVEAEAPDQSQPDHWRVIKDGRVFSLQVVAVPSSRTVDYLREIAPGKKGGAYLRVLQRPNGGSVIIMTLPLPPAGDAEQVSALLDNELKALVNLSESRTKAW
jgi:hypothetical protein